MESINEKKFQRLTQEEMLKIEGGEQVLGCGWDAQYPNQTAPAANGNGYDTFSVGRWEVFGIGVSKVSARVTDSSNSATNDGTSNS